MNTKIFIKNEEEKIIDSIKFPNCDEFEDGEVFIMGNDEFYLGLYFFENHKEFKYYFFANLNKFQIEYFSNSYFDIEDKLLKYSNIIQMSEKTTVLKDIEKMLIEIAQK